MESKKKTTKKKRKKRSDAGKKRSDDTGEPNPRANLVSASFSRRLLMGEYGATMLGGRHSKEHFAPPPPRWVTAATIDETLNKHPPEKHLQVSNHYLHVYGELHRVFEDFKKYGESQKTGKQKEVETLFMDLVRAHEKMLTEQPKGRQYGSNQTYIMDNQLRLFDAVADAVVKAKMNRESLLNSLDEIKEQFLKPP